MGSGVADGGSVGVSDRKGVSVKGSVGRAVAVSVGAASVKDPVGAGSLVAVGSEGEVILQAEAVNSSKVEKMRVYLTADVTLHVKEHIQMIVKWQTL